MLTCIAGAGPMQAPGLFDVPDKRGKYGLIHNIGLGGAVVCSLLRRPEFYKEGGEDGRKRCGHYYRSFAGGHGADETCAYFLRILCQAWLQPWSRVPAYHTPGCRQGQGAEELPIHPAACEAVRCILGVPAVFLCLDALVSE